MREISTLRYLALLLAATVAVGVVEIVFVHEGLSEKSDHLNNRAKMEQIAEAFGELYPERPLAHYVSGALKVRAEQFEPALSDFELAIRLRGTEENLLYDYAANLVACRRDDAEVQSAVDAWRFHFPKSARPDPRAAKTSTTQETDSELYQQAIAALRDEDFETARQKFEQDIRNGSRSEQLFYNYAVTLVLMSASETEISEAVDMWRRHFPFSQREDPRAILRLLSEESP